MPLDVLTDIPEPLAFQLQITDHFLPLLSGWGLGPQFEVGKWRYKGFYGGRGSMKSVSIAKCLITLAHHKKLLILCAREFQNSIADSVHRELRQQIEAMGLDQWFLIEKTRIVSKITGSEFIFKGLHYSIGEIKSMTGVSICWVEEAQSMSKESLLTLDPTLRTLGSEIWFSFNPDSERDPIYEFLVTNKPSNAYVQEVSWNDNPWFPEVLEAQRQRMLMTDPENYDWVWEGQTRKNAAATIFRNKVYVEYFDLPEETPRFYHGADWGFSQDPTCLIRCYIMPVMEGAKHIADDLYIDQEAYGYHTDIDATPALFDQIDTAREWPILADNSRPETISYIARTGFSIKAADKWQGSVEDGIMHLRGFRKIIVHPRCENIALEFRLYSYKIDPKTNEVLPLIVDKWNHGIDALRYAIDGLIQRRGNLSVWAKLGKTLSIPYVPGNPGYHNQHLRR